MSETAEHRTGRAQLVILIGIPGSGKSTWSQRLLADGYQIVSTDQLRIHLAGSLQAANRPDRQAFLNEIVFTEFYAQIRQLLEQGSRVIADATNLRASSRRCLLGLAASTGAEAHAVRFDDLDRARRQNTARPADAVVPPDIIEAMSAEYLIAVDEIGSDADAYASVLRVT